MDAESMDFWLSSLLWKLKRRREAITHPNLYIISFVVYSRQLRDMNVNDKSFLDEKDGRFAPFRRVLDAKIKDLLSKGLGTKTRKADPISHEDEELFRVNGVFGKSSATTLQYTVFYYTCKLFGLRGRDEHRNLDCDQFEIDIDSTGKFIRFIGRNNKTFKGGLRHMQLANKDIKHYSQGFIDEQEIMTRTGHRSTASVRAYKTIYGSIQKNVSKILNPPVLSSEDENTTVSNTVDELCTDDGYKMKNEKKHCLKDVTTMYGGAVSFSNCNFDFN
ncbi:unnamed protein product [Mytilus coruscus]|uniref:Uncharacterized protein n=1 Tax=Mytilus coruscus TaxID=42192 RepID=A0A6J8ANC5_MYTCO|nr:unnamed protein product [Mytilus coruscus]